jgi:hypothetical protein
MNIKIRDDLYRRVNWLMATDGMIQSPLRQLLSLFTSDYENSLSDVVEKTQQYWLRKKQTERWQMNHMDSVLSYNVMQIMENNKVFDVKAPHARHYDYAIVFGGFALRMRSRVDYLIQLLNQGVTFKRIVFLTAARIVDSQEIVESISTESDLLKMLIRDLPCDKKSIDFIQTPSPADGVRANTMDTIVYWLKTNPIPGSCLAITTHSFLEYHDSVLRTIMPVTFALETVAPQTIEPINIAEYLDNYARCLYVESQKIFD